MTVFGSRRDQTQGPRAPAVGLARGGAPPQRGVHGRTMFFLGVLSAVATVILGGCVGTDGGSPVAGRGTRTSVVGGSPHVVAEASHADAVNRLLRTMSPRDRIAQRFVVGIPRGVTATGWDTDVTSDGRLRPVMPRGGHAEPATPAATVSAAAFFGSIAAAPPAGAILYPWNYETRGDVLILMEKLQNAATQRYDDLRFLVGVDQEGGRVAAFRFDDMVRLPAAAATARHDDEEFIESTAYAIGTELRGLGVTMNFAPVVDLTTAGANTVIGDRAWGDDMGRVSRFAVAYHRGIETAGIIATVKHFPGHGVTVVDSHGRLPVVDMSIAELEASHLVPFQAAIDAGVPAVMTAHLLFPRIDPEYAVTVSEVFLHDILRERMGFRGVVVSDALSMRAITDNYELDLVLERAIRYDVDLLLLNVGFDYTDVLDRVEALVAEGRVSLEDIDRGTRRVLGLKYRFGLLGRKP